MTEDGGWAAHYENTILITEGEPEILPYKEEVSWGSFYEDLSRLSDYSMYAS